ncbi:MAG: leucine-rich repeat domain-containing protein, partial [Oscillospiraceae bacterium]|nr:leucine-rich repeat domain-containing protein [Oscillospiraceae bacterium]
MTKKILSLALILAMVLSIAPLSSAADEFEIIDGVLVKYIGYNAFFDCTSLTSITIPESVTRIYAESLGFYLVGTNKLKVSGFTISGISGSAAEKYAADNGFTFISL